MARLANLIADWKDQVFIGNVNDEESSVDQLDIRHIRDRLWKVSRQTKEVVGLTLYLNNKSPLNSSEELRETLEKHYLYVGGKAIKPRVFAPRTQYRSFAVALHGFGRGLDSHKIPKLMKRDITDAIKIEIQDQLRKWSRQTFKEKTKFALSQLREEAKGLIMPKGGETELMSLIYGQYKEFSSEIGKVIDAVIGT